MTRLIRQGQNNMFEILNGALLSIINTRVPYFISRNYALKYIH